MSATPRSAIRIMELFIHGYLWVYICLINMTIDERLLRRGDLGLKGEKKNIEREICHPERELGGLGRSRVLSGLLALKLLLT